MSALICQWVTAAIEALPRHQSAAVIVIIRSVGILGGVVSAALTGLLTHFGSNALLYFVMVLFALSAARMLAVSRRRD